MINLIYGAKGSGKTKKLIESANKSLETCKGSIVYITDNTEHSLELANKIRFVNVALDEIKWDCCFEAYIKGMLVSNYDLRKIYIDGIARIVGLKIEETEKLFSALDYVSGKYNVDFVCTVSAETLPKFLKKYI